MSNKQDTKYLSGSTQETLEIGQRFARRLEPGAVVCLYGELGSGKTVFVKGVCAGLGVEEDVTSPSFVIATEYTGKIPVSHIDLYRLNTTAVDELHFEEYILADGVTIIEWADRIGSQTRSCIAIYFTVLDSSSREIRIEDPRH